MYEKQVDKFVLFFDDLKDWKIEVKRFVTYKDKVWVKGSFKYEGECIDYIKPAEPIIAHKVVSYVYHRHKSRWYAASGGYKLVQCYMCGMEGPNEVLAMFSLYGDGMLHEQISDS